MRQGKDIERESNATFSSQIESSDSETLNESAGYLEAKIEVCKEM